MWIFDEDEPLTNEQVIQFANESNGDVVRKFPDRVLNNADNMLALIKGGYEYVVLRYCSSTLKADLTFLKEAAEYHHYTSQNSFFELIDLSLRNNKELLDIFAAKADDPYVKQLANEKKSLEKVLTESLTTTSKKRI